MARIRWCFSQITALDRPTWLETTFTDLDGSRKPFRLLSLPFYLATHWRRLAESVL
ncbi:MAG: hypothetical protein IJL06_05875 [Kiritimatiellae bacterium]|nr:hypothetical protein [Kiritimatiellia bacterium]